MSLSLPTPSDETPSAPPSTRSRSQRILACVLCQQRKVKCDRNFPCANCVRQNAKCVPATAARRRRRRFPERDLLARLQRYEELLRQHNVKFDPLHKDPVANVEAHDSDGEVSDDNHEASPADSAYEPRNVLYAISENFRDSTGATDSSLESGVLDVVHRGWDNYGLGDHVLLGSRGDPVDLSSLHPEPVHIFRLWQLYLDNVNPLLKVTHTPSLQGRIIEGATNLSSLSPVLEALMFGIYAMAVETLGPDECVATFASAKPDLMSRYQFGCQQALLNGNFLRSSNRESLVAFFLYLVCTLSALCHANHQTSLRTTVVPSSLAALCGIAVRIAQRMGLHNEAAVAVHPPFEAEMRRRLWWALVMYDARVTELAISKVTMLNPTWDCKIPSNVSDADLRPEMKDPPVAHARATDSIFVVVRSQLCEFTRHSKSYLEFTQPALKPIAKPCPDIDGIEKIIEEKYLRHCDLENPLHFVAVWTARGHFAKTRLLEYYAKMTSQPSTPCRADTQRDTLMGLAFRMLECDTQILASPATRGLQWLPRTHFPFPAYIHIVQDLRARPLSAVADRAWEVMGDNYEAWLSGGNLTEESPFRKFSKVVTLAWDARREATNETTPPRVVATIQRRLDELSGASPETASDSMDLSSAFPAFEDMNLLDIPNSSFDLAQPSLDMNQFTWPPVSWTMRPPGW